MPLPPNLAAAIVAAIVVAKNSPFPLFPQWASLKTLGPDWTVQGGWALHFSLDHEKSSNDTVIFVIAYLAILPLAELLSFGTEELAIRVGQTLAGLLHVTLRNVVELLVGGFMQKPAQLNVSLLVLSVTAILIPAAFKVTTTQNLQDSERQSDVLRTSHGVAIILLVIYISYLIFQLWSHAHLFNEKDVNNCSPSILYPPSDGKSRARFPVAKNTGSDGTGLNSTEEQGVQSNRAEGTSTAVQDGNVDAEKGVGTSAEDEETPQLTVVVAFGLLVILMAITTVFLVSSTDGLTQSGYISEEWTGLILLPLLGDTRELITAVSGSVRDRLDVSMGVAVGSSMQIALLVIPFLVVLAWIIEKTLTFLFDPFESIVLFLAVLTVAFAISDGRSNWLEGLILLSLYVILWFSPFIG
ncbi:Sodium/calcium exchanger protein-domain-containing protein [Cantharellus anzutake]|uniref:Sodium/calcium exchanger protein-domain-containing protein n=1 Tax=Cantharellus anzutake TaxID=1750568 RepID=UPI001905E293|nr:Sodium/calcium exchanger protein-domain-containing protein [Cantharellus anzutake]KAF8331982.1 Sodium/calcium exchanger protein-domain-containing protein [Cantharellus anzutake]